MNALLAGRGSFTAYAFALMIYSRLLFSCQSASFQSHSRVLRYALFFPLPAYRPGEYPTLSFSPCRASVFFSSFSPSCSKAWEPA